MTFAICIPIYGCGFAHVCFGVVDDPVSAYGLIESIKSLEAVVIQLIDTPADSGFQKPRYHYVQPGFRGSEFYFNRLPPRVCVPNAFQSLFLTLPDVKLDYPKVYLWSVKNQTVIQL